MTKPLTYFCSGDVVSLTCAEYGDYLQNLTEAQKLDLLILICEARVQALLESQAEKQDESAYPLFLMIGGASEESPALATGLIEAIAHLIAHPLPQSNPITVEVAGLPVEVEPTEPLNLPRAAEGGTDEL